MAAAVKALVSHQLLVWARERAKVKIEDAAKSASVAVERFLEWEKGDDAPTVAQLRCLANKYHFPLAVFYLPEPPNDFAPLRDFRRLPDNWETISPNLAFHIRTAYERRELALELNADLNTPAPPFPLRATLEDDPEMVGEAIRKFLAIDDQSQRKAAQQGRAFDYWRRKLEEHSVLVFVISGPHYSVPVDEMRGFAIAKPELPVIVVNGRDHSQGGKTFTLLHELVHIILGESALSNGADDDLGSSTEEQQIERFCDAVAAAALMPSHLLSSFPQFARSGIHAWTFDELRPIANAMGVSRHALLLRFVSLRRASWDFYRSQRPRFEEEVHAAGQKEQKQEVRIKRPVLLMSWNGRGFTRLVLRSYYDKRITLSDVAAYLGARLKHIPTLERAAFQGLE